MQLLSLLLLPLTLLGVAVSAADVHTDKPLPKEPQLRYVFCKYSSPFWWRGCSAYMSYRTPNGEQIVKIGETWWLNCEALMYKKKSNEAGFTTGRSSVLGKFFKNGVKLSYKEKSFTADWPKTAYLTDIDDTENLCNKEIFPARKSEHLDTTRVVRSGKHGTRMTGSYQLIYNGVPDILPPKQLQRL